MDITISCDAGYNKIKNLGKIAVIVKENDTDNELFRLSEEVSITNSVMGEYYAVKNSIIYIVNNINNITSACIYNDCSSVIDMIKKRWSIEGVSTEDFNETYKLLDIIKKSNIPFKIEWRDRELMSEVDELCSTREKLGSTKKKKRHKKKKSRGNKNHLKSPVDFNFITKDYEGMLVKVPFDTEEIIDISKVKIPKYIKKSGINIERYNMNKEYYNKFLSIDRPVVLYEDYSLFEGYSKIYLLTELNIPYVPIRIKRKQNDTNIA